MRDTVGLPLTSLAILVALSWPVTETRVAVRTSSRMFVLDVWRDDVVVVPRHALYFIEGEIVDEDIDATARVERQRLASRASKAWFNEYRDYAEVTARMRELAETAPDRARMHEVGRSIEGRAIWALRIGRGTPMLVTGTQHAREWISTMVTTCVADRLVREYASNPRVKAFVDSTELWVVPIVNPDGYQHAWSSDRYWRKNRRGPHGVDLNRNWGVAWGGDGSSDRERSETYRGKHAFSEPESVALRDLALRERFAMHIDFHSFGQLVMHPWCHKRSPAHDRDRFRAVGDRMASAIFAAHENRYELQQCGGASGTMMDWMYGESGTTSFIIELRPKRGGGGFVLPPEEILPTCDEGFAAVLEQRHPLEDL